MDLLQALDRTRDETLRHFELGLLGDIDEDKVSFYRATTRRHTLSPTVVSSPTNLSEIRRVFAEY